MACKHISGRNMYIWQFRQVVKGPSAIEKFLQQATDAKLDGVWIKIAVGASLYRKGLGTDLSLFNEAVAGLHERGLAVLGWHEPRCPNIETALTEAENVTEYVDELKLDGLLMDAESKSGSNFFQGGEDEAYAYAKTLHVFLHKADKGLAISSHDQPSKHAGFPFAAFAANADCNAPQLYYGSSASVEQRLTQCLNDPANCACSSAVAPVGAAWVGGDGGCRSSQECAQRAVEFIALTKQYDFSGYGFWVWDSAPQAFWNALSEN